ncbi:hypothetical protein AB0M43_15915 [Longispora sp. NPDC051575]|uniref:hypothetical protein n=1 Tax=Longispora sp. NPDC051575 TaxID=3154943 RepID=UPI0034382695
MVNEIGYGSFSRAEVTYLVEGNPMCSELRLLRLTDGEAVLVGVIVDPGCTLSLFRPADPGLAPDEQRHLLLKALEVYHLHHGRDFTDLTECLLNVSAPLRNLPGR